jgi:hypothetical protein
MKISVAEHPSVQCIMHSVLVFARVSVTRKVGNLPYVTDRHGVEGKSNGPLAASKLCMVARLLRQLAI